MSDPAQQAERIIARWRRAFVAIYLLIVFAAAGMVLLSLLAVHCGANREPITGQQINVSANDPGELRDCHHRLSLLLTQLHKETFAILARAQRFETEPAIEWESWSRSWRQRWKVVAYRCRLSELAGKGVSPELDKMAEVHAHLDELHLSYTGVVNSFATRYVDRLRKLKQEVAMVRTMIDRRWRDGSKSPGATQ